MAEIPRRRKEQSPGAPDILSMIARAAESIREHTSQPVAPSTEPQRTLDPLIYGASSSPLRKQSPPPQQRQKIHGVDARHREAPQPLLTDETLAIFDSVFRSRATQVAPQPIAPVQVASPRAAEVTPLVVEQPEIQPAIQVTVENFDEMQPLIPAPDTREAAVFEYELQKAQRIVETAYQEGYRPQLLVGDFSPKVLAFLKACGQGDYFVKSARPRVVSIEHLMTQATEAAASQQEQSRRPNTLPEHRERTDRRRMSPKMRNRLVGAAACAVTPFGLFAASYAATIEWVCKPDSIAAKSACGALAFNANLIDATPVINTYSGIVNFPVEVYHSIVDKDTTKPQANTNPEGKR